MTLVTKKYDLRDVFLLHFKVAPLLVMLQFIIVIMQAIVPMVLITLATAHFIDTALAILAQGHHHQNIYFPLVWLLFIVGVNRLLGNLFTLVWKKMGLVLEAKLTPAFVHVQAHLSFEHLENEKSWELIHRVAEAPASALQSGLMASFTLMRSVITIVSVLGLIVIQVWWASVVILICSAPLFYLSLRMGKNVYQSEVETQALVRRYEYVDDVLTNREAAEERSLFQYGSHVSQTYIEHYEAARMERLKVKLKQFVISKGASLFLSLIALLIAVTLVHPVIIGELSPGLYMGIVSAVLGMINALGWRMQSAVEGISKANCYMKDLTTFVALSRTKGAVDLPDQKPVELKQIEFKNVTFKYPTSKHYIFKNLSFKLKCDKQYAFVGVNGAGKTTLIKLLTGLYTDYSGDILINDQELRDYPLRTIKALFSVVYQDFARYEISLLDNIALGRCAHVNSEESLMEVAKRAGLADDIKIFEKGLKTSLGKILEGGIDLSGGQWQKVAIARALLSPAPIKILDEPTAALDPLAESHLYEEFDQLMTGKMSILISHRLGSTKLADEILVIDEGRIIERGTHEALMHQAGVYANMFNTQKEWYA